LNLKGVRFFYNAPVNLRILGGCAIYMVEGVVGFINIIRFS